MASIRLNQVKARNPRNKLAVTREHVLDGPVDHVFLLSRLIYAAGSTKPTRVVMLLRERAEEKKRKRWLGYRAGTAFIRSALR